MPHLDERLDWVPLYHAARARKARMVGLVARRAIRQLLRALPRAKAALNGTLGAAAFRPALY